MKCSKPESESESESESEKRGRSLVSIEFVLYMAVWAVGAPLAVIADWITPDGPDLPDEE